jgi:hypothetical protein
MPRPHAGEAIQLTFEAKHPLLFDQNGKRVALRNHPAHSQELTLA